MGAAWRIHPVQSNSIGFTIQMFLFISHGLYNYDGRYTLFIYCDIFMKSVIIILNN
jgi:hypothetical protein